MIEYSPNKLIDLVLRFGAATENQLRKYFNSASHNQIFNDLKKRYFDSEVVDLNVANENGSFKRRKILVFFVISKYRKELKKLGYDVKVSNTKASYGRIDWLYHELLVFESFIHLTEKFAQELGFSTERELKRFGENPADLRIYYAEDGEDKQLDCEIVVKNHRHQISSKSNDMLYFTPLQSKKDFIDERKKTDAILLNLDFSTGKNSMQKYQLTKLDERIISALTLAQAPLNASGIAAILKLDRGYIVPYLNNLAEERHLYTAKVQLAKSKCNKLFSLCEYDLITQSDRIFSVLYSKSICKLAKTGSQIIHVDFDNHFFVSENAHKRRRICYIDGFKSISKELERFERIKQFAAKCNADSLFIAADLERFKEVKFMYNEPSVFCFAHKAESQAINHT